MKSYQHFFLAAVSAESYAGKTLHCPVVSYAQYWDKLSTGHGRFVLLNFVCSTDDHQVLTDVVFSLFFAGLEPVGNTAGNPARFIVETFSAGRGDLTVTVLNPRGVQEPASSSRHCCMLLLH